MNPNYKRKIHWGADSRLYFVMLFAVRKGLQFPKFKTNLRIPVS